MLLVALMLGGLYYVRSIVRQMRDRSQYKVAQRIVHEFDFTLEDELEPPVKL